MNNGRRTMNPEQSTVVSADGTTIAYERLGQGPTVVLVGAALSDRSDLRRLADLLAAHHTVVNYDRRGRGRSGDAATWSPAREIEDLDALITANGGTASVFGSSSGAVLALDAAAALPDRVHSVAAYEAPVIVDDRRPPVPADAIERVEDMVAAGRRADAVRYFQSAVLGAPWAMTAMIRIMVPVWRQMVAMAPTIPYDLRLLDGLQSGGPLPAGRWSSLRAPTLVMVGGKGEPFMRTGSEALAQALPTARREVLDGAHHATPIMKPAVLLPGLTAFLG